MAIPRQAGIGYRRGQGPLIEAYAQPTTHSDPAVRDAASRAWVEWEGHHVSIGTGGVVRSRRWDDDELVRSSRPSYRRGVPARGRGRVRRPVSHYWANNGFLVSPIVERMERLRGAPATLIHGRRDVSGPALSPGASTDPGSVASWSSTKERDTAVTPW